MSIFSSSNKDIPRDKVIQESISNTSFKYNSKLLSLIYSSGFSKYKARIY